MKHNQTVHVLDASAQLLFHNSSDNQQSEVGNDLFLFMLLMYNVDMGTIDKALEQRRKAIQQNEITHRAIFEPEVTKDKPTQSRKRKRVNNGIRNKNIS